LSLTSTEVLQCAEESPAISAWSKASFFMCEAGHLWEGTLPDIRPMSFHWFFRQGPLCLPITLADFFPVFFCIANTTLLI
jgi:hypothetical protein